MSQLLMVQGFLMQETQMQKGCHFLWHTVFVDALLFTAFIYCLGATYAVYKGAGSGMAGMAAAIPIQNLVWRCHTNPEMLPAPLAV